MNDLIFNLQSKILKIDLKVLKTTVLVTCVFGLIAHGFCFLNTNFSHDCLNNLVNSSSLKGYFQMGRFLRPFYQNIKCNWELPWVNGLLSLLFISFSIYLINDILGFKHIYIYITCGILVTCASYTLLNATYLHDTDSYALALLFVSIGLWISKNINKGHLIAIPFYIISCGLYQTYIEVAIFVYIILFVIKLLNNYDLKELIIELIKDAITIAVSMLIYYCIYKILLIVFNFEEGNSYNSVSMATNSIINTFKDRLYSVIYSEAYWFIFPNANKQKLIAIINVLLLIIAFVLIIKTAKENRIDKLKIFILCTTLIIAPFAINIITFLSNHAHALTLFPLYFCYIFVIALITKAEQIFGSKIRKIVIICFVIFLLIIADNCIFSNKVYLQKELINKNTLSTITRLVDRIEQIDGYDVGKTPVALVGNLNDSVLNYERSGSINYAMATGMWTQFDTTYYSTYVNYFKTYLGYPIALLSEQESTKYKDYDIVKQMESFPSKDSCKFIDGVLVIKLSNIE